MVFATLDIHRPPITPKEGQDGPLRRGGIDCCEMDGEAVLYDVAHHAVHYLNETACCIWHHCDGQHDLESIANAIIESFGLDIATADDRREVLEDVNATLDSLRSNGLLDEANGYRRWLG